MIISVINHTKGLGDEEVQAALALADSPPSSRGRPPQKRSSDSSRTHSARD
jgi:hypothetical protein